VALDPSGAAISGEYSFPARRQPPFFFTLQQQQLLNPTTPMASARAFKCYTLVHSELITAGTDDGRYKVPIVVRRLGETTTTGIDGDWSCSSSQEETFRLLHDPACRTLTRRSVPSWKANASGGQSWWK